MKNVFYYQTSLGKIAIADNGNAITDLCLGGDLILPNININETPLIREAFVQLSDYLAGKRQSFELPLAAEGTKFQQSVWNALKLIPYGETRSYREIAESIGNPRACRAVGMANNKNPLAIFIPCHRVIGANGKLIGYGSGLEIKAQLLELEKWHGNL